MDILNVQKPGEQVAPLELALVGVLHQQKPGLSRGQLFNYSW